MEYELKISPLAHEDLLNIFEYVKKDGESIAKKQIENIYESLSNLQIFPTIGKKLSNFITTETNYMYLVIKKIYIAFYLLEDNTIEIIRIFRGEQDYIKELELK